MREREAAGVVLSAPPLAGPGLAQEPAEFRLTAPAAADSVSADSDSRCVPPRFGRPRSRSQPAGSSGPPRPFSNFLSDYSSMKRTQILLPDEVHRKLLKQAKARKMSMGELIRQAVDRIYAPRLDDLALVAYRNGLISLGKLADLSGTNPTRALELLREKGITPLFGPETAAEARQDATIAARAR